MNWIDERRTIKKTAAPVSPFARTALVLQGGGALGAYQAGVTRSSPRLDMNLIGLPESLLEASMRRS